MQGEDPTSHTLHNSGWSAMVLVANAPWLACPAAAAGCRFEFAQINSWFEELESAQEFKNGEIALWPKIHAVKCHKQWKLYNILDTFNKTESHIRLIIP